MSKHVIRVGIVIGRFQTPHLHAGHLALLRELNKFDQKFILVGQSKADPDSYNPLPFEAVRTMLWSKCITAQIFPLMDNRSDADWSASVDDLVGRYINGPVEDCTLIYGRDSFISHYTGRIRGRREMDDSYTSSTKYREQIKTRNSPWMDESFREGVIWARMWDRPKCLPTVDVAIFKHSADVRGIVLIRKKGEKKWRLPGGFVNPGEALETAARREALEECGYIEISNPRFLQSFPVDDWRLRKSPHKITTSLFMSSYVFGKLEAGDDAHELQVCPVQFTDLDQIVEEHHPLFKLLHSRGLICLPGWQV